MFNILKGPRCSLNILGMRKYLILKKYLCPLIKSGGHMESRVEVTQQYCTPDWDRNSTLVLEDILEASGDWRANPV